MVSINSRRSGDSNDVAMTWWKYLLLASLLLLVGFLIRLNLQLVNQIGHSSNGHAATSAAAAAMLQEGGRRGRDGASAGQLRLKSLRKQVSSLKEKVVSMRNMMKDIQEQNEEGAAPSLSDGEGGFPRLTCTPEVAHRQTKRMNARSVEWWSHSGCPDQVWMDDIHSLFHAATKKSDAAKKLYLVLDIGCNKGYTSADFLDALSPGTNINPHTLVNSIRAVAREMNTKFERDGGVCNDSNKPLNKERKATSRTEVHCFEPSPATYQMLTKAREKLMPHGVNNPHEKASWKIHNLGLHQVDGQMSWHSACATAVGDELCTIVPDGTQDSIQVPVATVDSFLKENFPVEERMPLVHMLKIDAEGLDPAVLTGATTLLTQNRAMMVMFEFNPGLSEKDPPHGMWGKRGNPRAKLLEVTAWLDRLGYDCYFDTRLVDKREREKGVQEAPALYRITGDCLSEEPRVRGWSNVVCASRNFESVAATLRMLATMV